MTPVRGPTAAVPPYGRPGRDMPRRLAQRTRRRPPYNPNRPHVPLQRRPGRSTNVARAYTPADYRSWRCSPLTTNHLLIHEVSLLWELTYNILFTSKGRQRNGSPGLGKIPGVGSLTSGVLNPKLVTTVRERLETMAGYIVHQYSFLSGLYLP